METQQEMDQEEEEDQTMQQEPQHRTALRRTVSHHLWSLVALPTMVQEMATFFFVRRLKKTRWMKTMTK